MRSPTKLSLVAATTVILISTVIGASSSTSQSAGCHASRGVFPDRACTPGVKNPAVTQGTIHATICVSGWTASVRPASSTTRPEKLASMAAYGSSGGTGLYEYDHLISLELGGALNDTRNMWPEPHTAMVNGREYGSFAKDEVENALRRAVCAGTLKLAAAQKLEAGNWTLGLKLVPSNMLPALHR